MKSRTLFATALILLTPLVVLAFQAQANRMRRAELRGRPFTAGPLKITIISFGHGFISFGIKADPRYIEPIQVEVENTSDEFTTFVPQRLSFVDRDNRQADIQGLICQQLERRIAPKANIKDWYDLTSRVRLPARLYYDGKLLATIIE
jgi:hypothetical protein